MQLRGLTDAKTKGAADENVLPVVCTLVLHKLLARTSVVHRTRDCYHGGAKAGCQSQPGASLPRQLLALERHDIPCVHDGRRGAACRKGKRSKTRDPQTILIVSKACGRCETHKSYVHWENSKKSTEVASALTLNPSLRMKALVLVQIS